MRVIVDKMPSHPSECLYSINNENGYYNCEYAKVEHCSLQHNKSCKHLVEITDVLKQTK